MALRRRGRPRKPVSTHEKALMAKILDGQCTVGVVGLGYVGLPLALEFARKGISTLGVDVDDRKVRSLSRGANYIQDLDDAEIRRVVKDGSLSATTDFARLAECDVVYICVPTPFTENKDPDISHIVSATEELAKVLRKGHLVILKSTTFPGTTDSYVKPILDATKLKCGRDYFLAFSPERIDPGNKKWNTSNTPVVVGGVTGACTDLAIALVNELAQLSDRIGVNIWEVVEAASTKPFGFMPFYPGPGIGGHCILIDPYYLSWMAREKDFVTNFVTLAAEVNESMPFYVRAMIEREVAKQPITMKDAKVLLLGMAFKRDVDDLRHSPALKVAELLFEDGFTNVSYFDPYIPSVSVSGRDLTSRKHLTAKYLERQDVVVITTDHTDFDVEFIVQHSKVVIDTRNATKDIAARSNIVLLGDGQ